MLVDMKNYQTKVNPTIKIDAVRARKDFLLFVSD